jgi:hypothetical protein
MKNGSHHGGTTAGQVRSRAIGALFFAGFGQLWLALGLRSTPFAGARAESLCLAVSSVLLLAAFDLMRRAKQLPEGDVGSDDDLRSRLMFRAVNIIQWVSVVTAVTILSILHMPEYAVTAITVIVGLHLFPLAGSFRYAQHYVTGALLVVWPLGCLAELPSTQVSDMTALGAGVVLLLSAAAMLVRNLWVWRLSDGPMGALPGQL